MWKISSIIKKKLWTCKFSDTSLTESCNKYSTLNVQLPYLGYLWVEEVGKEEGKGRCRV
jgi:hypothetical protein